MGKRTIILDDEDDSEIDAEENGRGARDTDNDKEVYGGRDEYEKDGFVVDDVDEQDEDEERNDDTEKRKKRKKIRESEKNYTLDDDDYELLHDNNVVGFHHPKHGSKKFKRLKKVGTNTDQGEQSGFSYDEEVDKNRYSGRTAEEDLKRSLFGDDEGEPLDSIAEGKEGTEEDEYIDEDDQMADFIVDEEEVDNYGARVRKNPNKKKLKHTPRVSLPALQEAHDIFGDVGELLMKHKQGLANSGSFDDSRKQSVKRIEDEFEPFILMDKYATEKDNRIQEIDVPERIQLLEEITGPVPKDDKSIDEESGWIYNQLTVSSMSPFVGSMHLIREITKEDIGNVLRMLHVQKFDIPFIAMYRKELCLSLLKDPEHDEVEGEDNAERKCKLKWHKILWAIQSLDRKWLILQKRKTALQLYYSKRFQEESRMLDDETRLKLIQQIFKSVIESLKASESEREVDDVDSKFNLHFPSGDVMEDGQFRRPKRKSLYSICCVAGLWEVACKFGFSSEQFGSLLNLDKMRVDELEDAKETPEEIAANFTCAMFETPQDVLKGARHMAAVEISCEPCVRKHVSNIFMENATVSTSPTSDGNAAIDSFHQFSSVKWLRDKPISEFKDAQWLLIQKAEEEKLLHVCIKLPETVQTKLMSDSKDCYVSDGVSRSAQLWNEQRELILKDAFFSFLLASMEREARSLLSVRSKNWLLIEYGQQLWDKVSVAPFKQKENDAGLNDNTAPRVMACCWGPGKPATTFVMLDSSGEVLNVLHAGSINIRSQSVTEQQRRNNDEQRLVKFMMDHRPHVLIVGAVNASSTRLKDEIFEIIFNLIEKHPMEAGQNMSEMAIVFGDESLPRIYENSRVSSDQLTGHQGIVKRAVALGRYLQNPLAMIATLCGPGREILSWKLSPLDHFLGPDEKYGVVEQVMIDATNQVGIDINLAASHEWLFAPLQFVSGLGPRKAHAMKRALIRAGAVFSRKEIPMNGILKKKAFINAIGFLRVRRSGMAATSNRVMDLLDDTRIHPESYDLAKKMAKDVCDEDVQDDPDDKENDLEMVIERIRQRPKLLKVLDIEEYSKSMEEQLGMRKRETLADIHLELLHGFQDWRRQYREPNLDDVFYMISGETENTLLEGRIVQATVRRVQTQRLICELESGLTGVIYKEDFSNESDIELAEKVIEGSIFMCKIKGIQKDRFQVLLSCRLSEPNNEPQSFVKQDPYYHEEKSKLRNAQDSGHKDELLKKFFKPRLILHPHFQNLSADGAMKFLSDKDPGESIFHPSCRGASYLTLTLKVYDNVYAHKVIVECGKDHKDMNSLLHIGKTLKIGESTFEDLDEVMDRYVDPLVTQLKAMLTYRKFKRGSRAEVDELLRAEKLEHPMRIVYGFGISFEHPGNFILSYIRTTVLRHEYISLLHNGFKFRKQNFDGNNSIDKLVAYFQKHIDDSGPFVQMTSATAPMRSPSSGGSSVRGSAGGAWGEAPTNSSDGGCRGQSGSNWDKASRPEEETGGNDSRDAVGQGHPSGIPRPHWLGQDHGSDHEKGSDFTSSNWASNSKVGDDEWCKFSGAKVQNSPGGWGDWGSVGGDTGGTLGSASQDGGSNSNWGGNGDVSGGGQSRGTDGCGGVGKESGGNSGRVGSEGGGWGGGSSGKGDNDSGGGAAIGGWDHEKNGGTDFVVRGDGSGDGNSGWGGSQVGGSTGDGNHGNWGDGGTSRGCGGWGFRGRDSRGRGGWGSGDSGAWDSGSGGWGNGDGSGSGDLHSDNSGGGRSGWGGRQGGCGDRGGGRVGWEGGGGSNNDSDGSGHWGSGGGDGGGRRGGSRGGRGLGDSDGGGRRGGRGVRGGRSNNDSDGSGRWGSDDGGGRRGGSRGGRGFGGWGSDDGDGGRRGGSRGGRGFGGGRGRGRGHRGRGDGGGGNGSGSWGNSSDNNGGGWGKSDGGGNSGGWGKSDSSNNNGSWSKSERNSSGWGRGRGSGSGSGEGGWSTSGGGSVGWDSGSGSGSGRGGWDSSSGGNCGRRGGWSGSGGSGRGGWSSSRGSNGGGRGGGNDSESGGWGRSGTGVDSGGLGGEADGGQGSGDWGTKGGADKGGLGGWH